MLAITVALFVLTFFYSFGQAKIEANGCGAADAVMLDVDGFVSETNATNLFMVKNGVLMTPATGSCLPGITRWADGGGGWRHFVSG